jgi:hypothetical protein
MPGSPSNAPPKESYKHANGRPQSLMDMIRTEILRMDDSNEEQVGAPREYVARRKGNFGRGAIAQR